MHLQRRQRPRGRLARPQVVDDPVGRHDVAAGGHEPGEDRPLPRPAERRGSPADEDAHGAQHVDLDGDGRGHGAGGVRSSTLPILP